MVPRHAPLPSMLIAILASCKALRKAMEVNWLPCSVFRVSGGPYQGSASHNDYTHGPVSSVIESRHASPLRLNQSTTTASRYTTTRAKDTEVLVIRPDSGNP